jgi:hypothetical protein
MAVTLIKPESGLITRDEPFANVVFDAMAPLLPALLVESIGVLRGDTA